MARTANAKSLRQLLRFHLLTVGLFASAKDVLESVKADKNNEYVSFGDAQVQIAQVRKDILADVGIKQPGGRGRMSLVEREKIEAKLKSPAVGNKLRGMKKSLSGVYNRLERETAAA